METGDGLQSEAEHFFFFEGFGIIMEKTFNGKLRNLYCLPTTATVAKSRREQLTGHVYALIKKQTQLILWEIYTYMRTRDFKETVVK